MKRENGIKIHFQKATANTNPRMDKVVLEDVLTTYKKTLGSKSISSKPDIWRIIMKSRITKYAAAAVIVLVVGISIAVMNNPYNTGSDQISEPVAQESATTPEATTTKIASELKKVEQLFASGDVKGLVSVLAGDEYAYESKVAAANFLADIGDDSAIAELEKLSNEQIAEDSNPFAAAIEAIKIRTEGIVAEGAEAPAPSESEAVAAVDGSAVKKVGDELLQLLPTESLFCLRVNNFDSAVGMMDQYLTGVSPIPVGLSMLARMQLVGLLGDPALNNINTQGNFALFGVGLQGQAGQSKQTGNMFIAALLPVTDYTKLVSENVNYNEPDANGVSVIKVGGTVNPNKTRLAVRVGNYILISVSGNYDDLVSMGKLVTGAAGLGASLGADEANAAMTEPLWGYGNIQQVSEVFGPVLVEGLEQMKKQIEKMNESGQGGPPAAIMNMYFGMLDVVLNEVEFFSVRIRPQANVCSMTVNMAAVPETLMAKMLATDISDAPENKLLGYLQDGAIFNVAIKKNTAFWEEYSLSQFDMISFLSEEGISQETIEKLEKVTSELIASAGQSGAISFTFNNQQDQMPFALQYVFEVKDAQRWNKAIDDAMDLWNIGFKSLTQMGIEGKYEIERAVDTYKDVSIDAAKFSMKATDPNTDYGKMLDKIYKGGIDYRMAMVDDLYLFVFDSNSDSAIHKLIDEAKDGGPKEIAPEFAAALPLLTQADKSDFVGTVNAVRYLNMAGAMAQAMGTELSPTGVVMPSINALSNSNMAFAGKVGGGTMVFEIALPKEHLLEIKAAAEMMGQKMAEAQQAAAEQAESTVEDTDSPDDVNDANQPG